MCRRCCPSQTLAAKASDGRVGRHRQLLQVDGLSVLSSAAQFVPETGHAKHEADVDAQGRGGERRGGDPPRRDLRQVGIDADGRKEEMETERREKRQGGGGVVGCCLQESLGRRGEDCHQHTARARHDPAELLLYQVGATYDGVPHGDGDDRAELGI